MFSTVLPCWRRASDWQWKALSTLPLLADGIHPVKQDAPCGDLYGIHGNIQEWVSDWHQPHSTTPQELINPGGPPAGQFRVVRGRRNGLPAMPESPQTFSWMPSDRFVRFGFRLARAVDNSKKGLSSSMISEKRYSRPTRIEPPPLCPTGRNPY